MGDPADPSGPGRAAPNTIEIGVAKYLLVEGGGEKVHLAAEADVGSESALPAVQPHHLDPDSPLWEPTAESYDQALLTQAKWWLWRNAPTITDSGGNVVPLEVVAFYSLPDGTFLGDNPGLQVGGQFDGQSISTIPTNGSATAPTVAVDSFGVSHSVPAGSTMFVEMTDVFGAAYLQVFSAPITCQQGPTTSPRGKSASSNGNSGIVAWRGWIAKFPPDYEVVFTKRAAADLANFFQALDSAQDLHDIVAGSTTIVKAVKAAFPSVNPAKIQSLIDDAINGKTLALFDLQVLVSSAEVKVNQAHNTGQCFALVDGPLPGVQSLHCS